MDFHVSWLVVIGLYVLMHHVSYLMHARHVGKNNVISNFIQFIQLIFLINPIDGNRQAKEDNMWEEL